MNNRSVAVLVSPSLPEYENYIRFVKPYLDHFGFPYFEVDGEDIPECALIMTGHAGVQLSPAAIEAVKAGTGVFCLDPNALPECWLMQGHDGRATGAVFADCGHYITALHECGERIPFYSELEIMCGMSLKGGRMLVSADGIPLVEVDDSHGGRVVLMSSIGWMSHKVLGPIHGMDDLVWRSVVWAAKKPFAMKGMPAFVGMRVDDVWGAWREINAENPLVWVDIANRFGIKPWLGLFQDNMDEATIAKTRALVAEGKASAFPHAFAGCEWVPSTVPENWAHFDHRAKAPHSDEVMAENAARIKAWYADAGIPICKTALAHYYETGSNAVRHIIDMGCEFIGIHMQPDTPYGDGPWLKAGPYRNYEEGVICSSRPVYYGDYLQVDNAPELSGKLFNCVTEIRDISGYEWHPSAWVERTVKRGIAHLRRAYDSMVPGVLFTHESSWIQRMSPKTWEAALEGIMEGVKGYDPLFWTMDDICGYARASHDIAITAAQAEGGKLTLTVRGENDRATMCCLFTDQGGEISMRRADLPQVSGRADVTVE